MLHAAQSRSLGCYWLVSAGTEGSRDRISAIPRLAQG